MVQEERELRWYQEALLIEEKLAQLDQLINESNQPSSNTPQTEPLIEIDDIDTSNNNASNLLIVGPENTKSGSIQRLYSQAKLTNSDVGEARPGLYIAVQTFYPPSQEYIYISLKSYVKVFSIMNRICHCENQTTKEVGLIPLDYLLPLSFEFLFDMINSEQKQQSLTRLSGVENQSRVINKDINLDEQSSDVETIEISLTDLEVMKASCDEYPNDQSACNENEFVISLQDLEDLRSANDELDSTTSANIDYHGPLNIERTAFTETNNSLIQTNYPAATVKPLNANAKEYTPLNASAKKSLSLNVNPKAFTPLNFNAKEFVPKNISLFEGQAVDENLNQNNDNLPHCLPTKTNENPLIFIAFQQKAYKKVQIFGNFNEYSRYVDLFFDPKSKLWVCFVECIGFKPLDFVFFKFMVDKQQKLLSTTATDYENGQVGVTGDMNVIRLVNFCHGIYIEKTVPKLKEVRYLIPKRMFWSSSLTKSIDFIDIINSVEILDAVELVESLAVFEKIKNMRYDFLEMKNENNLKEISLEVFEGSKKINAEEDSMIRLPKNESEEIRYIAEEKALKNIEAACMIDLPKQFFGCEAKVIFSLHISDKTEEKNLNRYIPLNDKIMSTIHTESLNTKKTHHVSNGQGQKGSELSRLDSEISRYRIERREVLPLESFDDQYHQKKLVPGSCAIELDFSSRNISRKSTNFARKGRFCPENGYYLEHIGPLFGKIEKEILPMKPPSDSNLSKPLAADELQDNRFAMIESIDYSRLLEMAVQIENILIKEQKCHIQEPSIVNSSSILEKVKIIAHKYPGFTAFMSVVLLNLSTFWRIGLILFENSLHTFLIRVLFYGWIFASTVHMLKVIEMID